ncbi:hypothetical protein NAT51_00340 [Flavobacterium amniphilum]|uniref:hypothetical protein n=1 Tax=Flavobacterium amniphilum TaxID=1834035 RepID=UPI00202A26A0|nr:hypothetical protein [Flavobacterium amniphilum]MCL9803952.1 hypothetical protein [Flavobacterium amniphilum]
MSIRQEEFVPVADMLIASFERDQAQLEAENELFSETFLNAFKTHTEMVRQLERNDTLLIQQKIVTKELYQLADDLRQPLKLFGIVVEKTGLPTTIVHDTLVNLRLRNMEGLLVNLKSLDQIISSNLDLLNSKAMKANLPELLEEKFNEITIKSNLQSKIMQKRQLLTDANLGNYGKLYNEYIADVCKIGKVVYQGQAKAKEYTVSNLVKKLRVAPASNKKETVQ